MDNRPKITLVNHSDTRGGASVVSFRLMRALCANGADSRMVVAYKDSRDLRVDTAAGPRKTRTAFLAEAAQLWLADGMRRDNIFKLSTGAFGLPLHRHSWIQDSDAVILNWVNQGMVSLSEIQRLADTGKRIIWTMHDMWNMTSVCHHAGTCNRYADKCADCPMLKNKSLARKVFERKQKLYANSNITFVAVSDWLADKARNSTLLRNADIRVIPNPFPVEDYATTAEISRRSLHLPENRRLVVMAAARLDDPIKNLPLAIDALNRLAAQMPDVTAVFCGEIRNPHALDNLAIPHLALGTVPQRTMAAIYAHADAVLSTSLYETLPGTLVEGMAAGATPVATLSGGQADIVSDGVDGYLTGFDAAQIARALADALAKPFGRQAQHNAAERRFNRDTVAQKYLDLAFNK